MKAKVSRGGGFRGALKYVFDVGSEATNNKNAERVAGNMAGDSPRELAQEFAAVRQLRPDIEKPVWHCSLSLPAGERLSADQWQAVAGDFMQRMGFDQDATPWVAVRHQDTDKDHIHIVASRVSLEGKVWLGQWEARRAIEATQVLEKAHGLTLTAGLGEARAEKKQLTAQEINMAVRTGNEPPRQQLQRLLDEAIKDKPTAPELAERLQAAGVGVRANIASTGRMNGFSFELQGIQFKSSDLGKGYTWGSLQTAGVTYEQTRDSAGLERFKPATANRAKREDVAAEHGPDAASHAKPARRSLDRDGAGAGAAGHAAPGRAADAAIVRPGSEHSAQDAGRTDAGNEPQRSAVVPGESEQAGREPVGAIRQPVGPEIEPQQHGAGGARGRDTAGQAGQRAAEHDEGRKPTDRDSEPDTPEPLAPSAGVDSGRDRGRGDGGGWASRFKQASAAKRRNAGAEKLPGDVAENHTEGKRVDGKHHRAAREIDPTAYLEASGYEVERQGRHLSIKTGGDEVYRVTHQQDGHWLWCDRYGNRGGDNIDLVRELEPRAGYAEAVYKLSGAPTVRNKKEQTVVKKYNPPVIPFQNTSKMIEGRDYLISRSISLETIEHAEKSGMLRYADRAVLFVGYDREGTAQNITRREVLSGSAMQKRDLRGSDKGFPPILPGNPQKVWIVEGGADALALHDIARRNGQPVPTVIVSSGANVRSFLERSDVQAVLKRAERVTVAGENEKHPEAQERADAGHRKQAQRVAEITGREVRQWTPRPEQGKDLADMNARTVQKLERTRQAEQEAAQKAVQARQERKQEQPRQVEQDRGMEP